MTRTPSQLHQRLDELDQIFDTAPDDVRPVIAALHAGQLTFDDTAELLKSAADQQAARRDWIIERWPHIVEHQEVTRALIAPSSASVQTQQQALDPRNLPEVDSGIEM